jgi:hypothetical protein
MQLNPGISLSGSIYDLVEKEGAEKEDDQECA